MISPVISESDVQLVEKLAPHYKEILLATRTLASPTYKGLATHLNIPAGTVKSRLNRGMRALAILRSQQVTE